MTFVRACWVALLLSSGVDIGRAESFVMAEFVGSIPCGALAREFVGGLGMSAPCHCITWRLTFLTNQNIPLPRTFKLVADYGLPRQDDPNQMEDGPRVELQGTWEIGKGVKSRPDAVVYELKATESKKSVSFVKFGDDLLHLLDKDKALMIGNASWSYTLNRKAGTE